MIKYISTRGGGAPQSFEQVLLDRPCAGWWVIRAGKLAEAGSGETEGQVLYVEVAEEVIFPFVAEMIVSRETLQRNS
jgi:hypothetical protein